VNDSSQAVVQTLVQSGVRPEACWNQTHSMRWRLRNGGARDASAAPIAAASAIAARDASDETLVDQAGDLISCLRGLRRAVSVSESEKVLRIGDVSDEPADVALPATATVADREWVNSTVASQVTHMLDDPVVVCCGAVPRWPLELCERVPGVLPLEARCMLLATGSCSLSRLATMMHARLSNSSATPLRLPGIVGQSLPKKVKITVTRGRSLETMAQVLLSEAGSNFAVDVEFAGEVGTGAGPTREFFSETCEELASRPRGLWRHHNTSGGYVPLPAQPSPAWSKFRGVSLRQCRSCHFVAVPPAADGGAGGGGSGAGGAACSQCGESHVTDIVWIMRSDNVKEFEAREQREGEEPILKRFSFAKCPHCKVVECWSGADSMATGDGSGQRTQREGAFVHLNTACNNALLATERVLLHSRDFPALVRAVADGEALDPDAHHAAWWWQLPALDDCGRQDDEAALVLHPAALSPEADQATRAATDEFFSFVGRLAAFSIVDSRLLDLPLSVPFLRAVQNAGVSDAAVPPRNVSDDLREVLQLDPRLGQELIKMHRLARRRLDIECDELLTPSQRREAIAELTYGGAMVEDLYLDFTLPGAVDVPLPNACGVGGTGGAETPVTLDNLGSYVEAVLDAILRTSIAVAAQAFRAGIATVFDPALLDLFSPDELQVLFCGASDSGADEEWTVPALLGAIRCDHGYTTSSGAVQMLVEVLSDLDPVLRRQFLLFTTGSPRLPVGGFNALLPRLTIVQKKPLPGRSPDASLPSASTCTNYLKLPQYTSKEIMHERLVRAITDGAGAFHLS